MIAVYKCLYYINILNNNKPVYVLEIILYLKLDFLTENKASFTN